MNVEAICPLCYAAHVVPSEMRGERYRCEECEEVFVVNRRSKTTTRKPKVRTVQPADEEPTRKGAEPVEAIPVEPAELLPEAIQAEGSKLKTKPAATRRAEDEGEKPRSRRGADRDEEDDGPKARPARRPGGAPVGLIVGGVVVGLLLLAGLGLGGWWLLRSPGKPAPVAQTPPPDDAPQPEPPKHVPPKIDHPMPRPPKPEPPKPEAPKPALWGVKVDAPAKPFRLEHAAKQEIKVPGADPLLLFPATPSPFVMVVWRGVGNECQVVDLRTTQVSGQFTAPSLAAHLLPPTVSPDGAHVAALEPRRLGTVNVWAVATGEKTAVEVHPTPVNLELLEFTGPGKLVTCKPTRDGKKVVQVWDVARGRAEREFDGPQFDRGATALSPNGTYLALGSADTVWVYDLKKGELAGQVAVAAAPQARGARLRALSFSPDGAELAALYLSAGATRSRLLVWDVAKGEPVVDCSPLPGLRPAGLSTAPGRGPIIDWLADRRGWVFFGQVAIDRAGGHSLGTLPGPAPGASAAPRRLVGPDHLVTLSGTLMGQTLSVERIDWNKIKPGGR
jgi:WD40 repeat protein